MKTTPIESTGNIICIHGGKPMVSSLKIAELFDRPHRNVLIAIRKELGHDGGEHKLLLTSYIDVQGKSRPAYYLSEEQALYIMPWIGGRKSREGQRLLVKAYLYYRDNYAEPPRLSLLKEKRSAHLPMQDALKELRDEMGKETETYHYQNENRLCNGIVTGKYKTIDEKQLSNEDVTMLEKVRRRNESLIMAGLLYDERKKRLLAWGMKYRTKLLVHD